MLVKADIARLRADAGIGPYSVGVWAGDLLFVSGQTPMRDGEVVGHGIVEQAKIAIENMLAIVTEAGYGVEDIMRVGVWLDDPRDFWSFNGVYAEYFSKNPPARACVEAKLYDPRVLVEMMVVAAQA